MLDCRGSAYLSLSFIITFICTTMLSCIFGRTAQHSTPPIEYFPTIEIKEPITSLAEYNDRLADFRELLVDNKLDY